MQPLISSVLSEELKMHWKIVSVSFKNGIAEVTHINEALRLFCDDLKYINDEKPSIQFILQERSLCLLVEIAQLPEPPGLANFILERIINVLDLLKPSLMANLAVYQPIQNILSWKMELLQKRLIAKLIGILVKKFKDYPFLLHYFFTEEDKLPQETSSCCLFQVLSELYKDLEIRNQTRVLVLGLLHAVTDSQMVSKIRATQLIEVTVSDLVDLWKELPNSIISNQLKMDKFINHINFCKKVTKGNAYLTLQEGLKKKIQIDFINNTLTPLFFNKNRNILNATVVYVREIILHIGMHNHISKMICSLLFQEIVHPETNKKLYIADHLIEFISQGQNLSTNILRLFSTLLEYGEKSYVINQYMLSSTSKHQPIINYQFQLPSPLEKDHPQTDPIEPKPTLTNTNPEASPEPIKTKENEENNIPISNSNSEQKTPESKNSNSESKVEKTKSNDPELIAKTKYYEQTLKRYANLCQIENIKETQEFVQAVKIVSKAKKRLHKLKKSQENTQSFMKNQLNQVVEAHPSVLMDVLLNQLKNFFAHGIEYNLFLTDTINKLCKCPQQNIFNFFMVTDLDSGLCLYDCLWELLKTSRVFSDERIKQARENLQEFYPEMIATANEGPEELHILLNEFCKEVTATLVAVEEKLFAKEVSLGSELTHLYSVPLELN